MPQVFIDNLTVENFGPFYGRSTINFAPIEDRCGILIGGKNGAGKTHLLRALYLAVVGETGVHDLKALETGSDATRFLFERTLNRKALAQGKEVSRLEIELTQRDERGAGAKKMKVVREITHRPSGQRWKSFVVKPDGNTEDDDAAIQRLRDSFLPRHLARFFFFDAERSQGVHLGDKDISASAREDRDALHQHILIERKRSTLPPDAAPLRDLYLKSEDEQIYQRLKGFFGLCNDYFWRKAGENSYITKTIGIQGQFDVMKRLAPGMDEAGFIKKSDEVLSQSKEIEFNDPFFQALGKGRNRVRNIILLLGGIIRLGEIPEREHTEYRRVCGNLLKQTE
jgi:hypothetical protein